MKWILQEILNNYSNVMKVENSLKNLGIEYILVNLNGSDLKVINKDLRIEEPNSQKIFEEFISEGNVFCYGGKAIINLSKKYNLKPGCFYSEELSFEYLKNNLEQELLNNDFIVGKLKDLSIHGESAFIRPVENSKLFTGLVVKREDLKKWQERENHSNSPFLNEELMLTSVKKVCQEFRFFVYKKEVVTYSSYSSEGVYNDGLKPTKELLDYADEIINKYELPLAYVLDIAIAEGSFKIVELNCINTSGLYSADVYALIKKLSFS